MNQSINPDGGKPMERVLYEVKKVIVGQDHLLERLIVALLARGHILVEGVPGLAKTMAIKTLAAARIIIVRNSTSKVFFRKIPVAPISLAGIILYKLGILLFNLVPYLSLRLLR